ncbi:MAG: hypothetical protein ACOYZ7_15030 [Chloroflexota bacterium]
MKQIRWLVWGALLLAASMAGCGSGTATPTGAVPTETVSALFLPVIPPATPRPAPTPTPTAPAAGATPEPSPTVDEPSTTVIYDDALAPGWSLDHSWDMALDAANGSPVHGGSQSIAATPLRGAGAVLIGVADPEGRSYLRDDYAGLRFWLNGGPQGIALDELTVTVLGSNTRPDFSPDDDSVEIDEARGPFFSETRLYYLGFNRAIPPETWAPVEVWLDELPYDPVYTFITAFYIKNDDAYFNTFYLDDIVLVGY